MPGALVSGVAEVSGVHFPTDPNEVVVYLGDRHIRASATPEQVATALDLRGRRVKVMILADRREKRHTHKLLWIYPEDVSPGIASPQHRAERILERWPETLAELARARSCTR